MLQFEENVHLSNDVHSSGFNGGKIKMNFAPVESKFESKDEDGKTEHIFQMTHTRVTFRINMVRDEDLQVKRATFASPTASLLSKLNGMKLSN